MLTTELTGLEWGVRVAHGMVGEVGLHPEVVDAVQRHAAVPPDGGFQGLISAPTDSLSTHTLSADTRQTHTHSQHTHTHSAHTHSGSGCRAAPRRGSTLTRI